MEMIRPETDVQSMALAFEVAPAYDLVFSLAAAANADKYEMPSSWARGVKASLPLTQRRDLGYFFGDASALGTGAVQLVPVIGSGDVVPFIVHLEGMEPADFVAALLCRPHADRGLRSAIRRLARGRATEDDTRRVHEYRLTLKLLTRKRFDEMLENPRETHARYVQLVRTHHECWFSQRYGDVLPFLEQRAKQARRSIGKLPAKEVIARATGGFTLRTPAARSVTLVPSYYTAPFVVVVSEGKDVVLVYGTRPREERTGTVVDGQTVKVLKALADETRLHILQLLAHRPLYGQQLAETLGLSHPTVSHHMAQLRIAGLTRTELTEDGTKAYFVQPETVEALCDALRAAFIQPSIVEDEERGAGR